MDHKISERSITVHCSVYQLNWENCRGYTSRIDHGLCYWQSQLFFTIVSLLLRVYFIPKIQFQPGVCSVKYIPNDTMFEKPLGFLTILLIDNIAKSKNPRFYATKTAAQVFVCFLKVFLLEIYKPLCFHWSHAGVHYNYHQQPYLTVGRKHPITWKCRRNSFTGRLHAEKMTQVGYLLNLIQVNELITFSEHHLRIFHCAKRYRV